MAPSGKRPAIMPIVNQVIASVAAFWPIGVVWLKNSTVKLPLHPSKPLSKNSTTAKSSSAGNFSRPSDLLRETLPEGLAFGKAMKQKKRMNRAITTETAFRGRL